MNNYDVEMWLCEYNENIIQYRDKSDKVLFFYRQ